MCRIPNLVKNKFVKETFWSLLSKATTFVLFFLLNIYLARALGVEDFGKWSFFYSITSIILLLSYFGINGSSKKYIAEYNKTSNLKNVLKAAVSARFIVSLIFSLLLALLHKPVASLVGNNDLATLFLIASPLVFFSGFVEFIKDVFSGLHRNKYGFVVNLLEYGLKFILVWLIFKESSGLSIVVWVFVVSLVVAGLAGIIILFSKYILGKNSDYELTTKDFMNKIFKYSLPMFVISIGFWIATDIDTVMLGFLKGDYEVGIFSAAKQIIVKLPHISAAISMGAMPIFAKLNKDNKQKLKKIFGRLIKINTIVIIIISAIIILLSRWFMPLLYGNNYSASATPLMLLVPYLVMFSYSIFLSSFLDYRGLAKKRAINLIFTIAANVILNYILIPKYGVNGAAIATSLSYLPYFILNWLEVNREFR